MACANANCKASPFPDERRHPVRAACLLFAVLVANALPACGDSGAARSGAGSDVTGTGAGGAGFTTGDDGAGGSIGQAGTAADAGNASCSLTMPCPNMYVCVNSGGVDTCQPRDEACTSSKNCNNDSFCCVDACLTDTDADGVCV